MPAVHEYACANLRAPMHGLEKPGRLARAAGAVYSTAAAAVAAAFPLSSPFFQNGNTHVTMWFSGKRKPDLTPGV